MKKIRALTHPVRAWLFDPNRSVLRLGILGGLAGALFLLANTWDIAENPPIKDEEGAHVIYDYFRQLLFAASIFLVPMVLAAFSHGSRFLRMMTTVIFSGFYLLIWLGGIIAEATSGSLLAYAGVQTSVTYDLIRYVLIGGLILSPPIVLFLYERASVLDRYVTREFLFPLVYCVIGFLAIVLIFDLSDNGSDFFDAKASLSMVAIFYLAMIPQLIVMVLPIAILLALLYSLSRMSRSNETIAMLTAGKSLPRILLPVFIVSTYCSLICTALNFEWAPESKRATSRIHNEIIVAAERREEAEKNPDAGKRRPEVKAITKYHKYRNRVDNRLWYISLIPYDLSQNKMRTVEIYQQDDEGTLTEAYFAKKAAWAKENREWLLRDGIKLTFDENGIESGRQNFEEVDLWKSGWRETPWMIFADELDAEDLGVPSLAFYLNSNKAIEKEENLAPFRTHWWYRWSLPWGCLVITLVAAPLGVVFSRRGVLGGVAASIFIAALFVFFDKFFLTLGQSGKAPAIVAAWANNFLFASVGAVLLYFRSRNRELPKPSIENFLNLFKKKDHQTRTTSSNSGGRGLEFS